jgi:rRNA maturation endonuclease Nob1
MIKIHKVRCIGCGDVVEHAYTAAICTRCGMMMYTEKAKKDVERAAIADAKKSKANKEVF